MRAYVTTLFAFLLLPTLGFAAGGTWATISTVLVVINALLYLAGACAPEYLIKAHMASPGSPHFYGKTVLTWTGLIALPILMFSSGHHMVGALWVTCIGLFIARIVKYIPR